MLDNIVRFCQESYQELKLSSWLSRQQMAASTIVVVVLTIIVAIYVACIDRVFLWIAGILFRIG
jgi:preprotein translocase SecE subunit